MVDFQAISEKLIDQGVAYLPKLVLAIITLVIGWFAIKLIVKMIGRSLEKRNVEQSLRHFLESLAGIMLKVLLFITVISMFGVEMTSFIAVLAAVGFAIGLALQGSLSNFAGGVLILIFKPFEVGDFIQAQGELGKVHRIRVFNTILKTPDNKTVIIPNGPLSNGNIVNFTTEPTRRVDLLFGIGYNDDIEKAREVINSIIKKDERILKDPAPQVVVKELGDSSVNFAVRVWSKGTDYWDVHFHMTEKVKLEFDKHKISIPFPQRDVHLHKH